MLTLRLPLVLASGSPRRQQLLSDMGLPFSVEIRPTDETFPETLPANEVAEYLARQKAERFVPDLGQRLVLCADTVVIVDEVILNKPHDEADAFRMLRQLARRSHRVRTGVCLLAPDAFGKPDMYSFTDETTVTFAPLTDAEIRYYIHKCRPFDKAGSYGAQDFVGLVGIERLDGSFYTVMGLPTHRVYQALKSFVV